MSQSKEGGLDIQSIRDELICPMCIGTFEEPRSLHCLHSYCEDCLVGLHKANVTSDVLFCPECRKKTTLPPMGIKGLPLNFKLKRIAELLTVEQRREIVRHGTLKSLPLTDRQLTCPIHETKPLEYYCETCCVMICGQCMLDDHRVHGNVKYASEVLEEHVQELQKIIPDADEVIESGEDMLESLKSEVRTLDDELTGGMATVSTYFTMLHKILQDREKNIVSGIKSKAKKKEKRLLKRIKTLSQAVKGVKNSKLTLQYAMENRSNEIGLLLEENQLRARVLASKRLVEDETLDCEIFVGGFSKFPTFIPDPSVESKCRSINFSMDSPVRRRSQTLINTSSDAECRRRANAFASSEVMVSKQVSRTLSGDTLYPSCHHTNLSPLTKIAAAADSLKLTKVYTIPDPISEIGTKSLIGHCNHVTAYPFGVCCMNQPQGALLVTDAKHHLFRVVTSTGKCLETIGTEGKGDGQFFMPVAIAVDEAGNTLVVDGKNPGRVQKFSNAGKFLTKFKVRSLLSGGSPHLVEPNGLAILMKRRILVTDGAKACIQEFEENGKYVGKFGNLMNLKCPAGIAASENRVVVADKGANCIYIFTEHGKQLACVGQEGAAPGDLHLPHGIALDEEGNIVISECGNHRISIFTPGGKFVRCFGCKGSDPGMFRFPRQLCFNHLGQLVVADEENQRLQFFDLSNLED